MLHHQYIETASHMFLHCEFSRAVWFGSDLGFHTIFSRNGSVSTSVYNPFGSLNIERLKSEVTFISLYSFLLHRVLKMLH